MFHAEPLSAQGSDLKDAVGDAIGFGRDQNVPLFQNVGQTIRIDVFRIDQHLARTEWKYRRIDVHRVGAAALDFVDSISLPEVPTKPCDAGGVGDVASGNKQIPPASEEVRGVEHGFKLRENVAHWRTFLRQPDIGIKELIGKLRLWRRSPTGASPEIILENWPIGMRLEVTAWPGHRRFDDFFAYDQHAVARTCVAEAV
jgi:hypothetical protein